MKLYLIAALFCFVSVQVSIKQSCLSGCIYGLEFVPMLYYMALL